MSNPSSNPSIRPRGRVARSMALVLALGAATGLAGCGTDSEVAEPTTTAAADGSSTTADTASTTTAATSTTSEGGGSTTAATGTDTTAGLGSLAEGPHHVYFKGISQGQVEGQAVSIVEVNVVELLTGQEAIDAAIANGDAEPGATSLDTDYYVLDEDPATIKLPVIPESQVTILDGGTPETVPAGIDDAVSTPGLYEIEVVVVRDVSLITGVQPEYLA